MAAHQATLSLGFFRQEHWNGLPFPSPMCESEVAQSCRLLATPWTAAYQAPPSMGFSRQEYWSGVPCLRHLRCLRYELNQKMTRLAPQLSLHNGKTFPAASELWALYCG